MASFQKITRLFALILFVSLPFAAQAATNALNTLSAKEITKRAEHAYYFTYPMLQGYQAIFGISLYPKSPSYFGPLNAVHSKPFTLNPSYTAVVSPNADTPYSIANLDLSDEPMVYHVPAIKDRYYVMQLVDLYGYNAHYIGTRVTGTDAGDYLLVGPYWQGRVPKGIKKVLRFETNLVLGIGRTQLLNDADLPKLKQIVAQYKVIPLSAYTHSKPPTAKKRDWPIWNPGILDDERFIVMASKMLQFAKPNPEDKAALKAMASIGISPDSDFDPEKLGKAQRVAIRMGINNAKEKMAQKARNLSQSLNGWQALSGFGDRAYFKGDYFLKAAAATVGYLANDAEEATYPVCRVDAKGRKLNGAHRYRLTLTEEPPNNAFWSITMYNTLKDGTGGFMVENPINRYLINNRTEGLIRGKDGSLTITISHNEPTNPVERANWLPAPEGDFYMIMRIYMPKPSVLDGSWMPRAVKRIQ